MIRRHVLAAIAAGVAAGEDDAARAALAKIDPVLRRRARRRLERSLIDAALATNEYGGFHDKEAARHVLRVAALDVARASTQVAPTDRDQVRATYASLPAVRPTRAPIATIVLALSMLVVAGGTYLYVDSLPGKAKRAYARPLPPPAAGAYKDGGVPLSDPAIEKLLVEDFTQLVVESGEDRRSSFDNPERKARAARLADAPAIIARGPLLTAAWRDMLAALDRWVHEPISSAEFETVNRALRTKVRTVSDQLAAVGIGYYLEGDVINTGGGVAAVIYSYRVEEVVFVTAGTAPHRVLSLRRLDRLNLVKTLLGMQSAELGDPVLLLDQIDEHVATRVLPVLEPDAPFPFVDTEYLASPEGKRVARIAGEAVRRDLLAALGADAARATQIATLLGERARMVERWRDMLDRQGLVMSRTRELFLGDDLIASLEGKVPASQRDRAGEIDDEIARLEGPRIASRCHQLVAATIRRHEAQHGLDDQRDSMLRYPPALEAQLGPANDRNDVPRRSVERARHELAAYTSQLANDPSTPQFSLWNVAQFAFAQASWGTPESYAAVLLIEALGKRLGLDVEPAIHSGAIDRERLAVIATQLAALPGDRLRAITREVWLELYGEPLVPIVDRP